MTDAKGSYAPPVDDQIVRIDGFLDDETYQRSPEMRCHWEMAGMRDFTAYIKREGLTLLDSPVGRWIGPESDSPPPHLWRYRVEGVAVAKGR